MSTANPMLNKKNGLLNIKQKVEDKTTGESFIEDKKMDLSVADLIKKPKKKDEKTLLGINIKKEVADKVKSFAYENDMTVSEVLEDVIEKMFKDIDVNEEALKSYEEKYKKKSKKTRD